MSVGDLKVVCVPRGSEWSVTLSDSPLSGRLTSTGTARISAHFRTGDILLIGPPGREGTH